MSGNREGRPVTAGPWPQGVNNVAKETALPKDDFGRTLAVREAVNVDFGPDGRAKRRDGYESVYAGTSAHSGWSDPNLPFGFFVDGEAMYVFHVDETTESLITGMAPGMPVSYVRVNDIVLWSNEVQSGQISLALETAPWSCRGPASQPTLTETSNGAMPKGMYQIAVTFFDAYGRESGALKAAPIEISDNSSIELTNIPQPGTGGRIRIYCTTGADGVLKAVDTLDDGTTSYTITAQPTGRKCDTVGLRTMPAGHITCVGNGRHFVAKNKEVLFSPPLRYGLYDPKKGRVGFSGRIRMLAFVGDGTPGAGLYVSDSKRTYFLAGENPDDWKQVIASPFTAVPGAAAFMPANAWGLETTVPVPVWLASNGVLYVGMPGGKVVPIKEDDVAIDRADAAALLFREEAGDRKLVAALRGAQTQQMAVRDRMIVREYRRYPEP